MRGRRFWFLARETGPMARWSRPSGSHRSLVFCLARPMLSRGEISMLKQLQFAALTLSCANTYAQ